MTENYAKAQRDKRDFDRTMKTLARENKMKLHLINTEQQTVGAGLLDLQSKSKNLSDTMQYITSKLQEEKKKAEEQLTKMSIERSNARHTIGDINGGVDDDVDKVRQHIGHCRKKLQWLEPPKKKSSVHQSVKVVDLIANKGFGAMLHKMRSKKQEEAEDDDKKTPEEKPKSAKDICSLIDHFKTLPKIYPSKPKKRKSKPTELMIEKYEERKKEREKAMSYVTRKRLRRVEFHYDTLKELFLTDG